MPVGTLAADVNRARIIEDRAGNLLLFVRSETDWWQYASDDQGATWVEVDAATAELHSINVALMSNGNIFVTWSPPSGDPNEFVVKAAIITNAYDLFSTADDYIVYSQYFTTFHAMTIDPSDGYIYIYAMLDYIAPSFAGGNIIECVRITPDGSSDIDVYTYPVIQYGAGGGSDPVQDTKIPRAVVFAGGEVVMALNAGYDISLIDGGSLVALTLGGWSSLENGDATDLREDRFGWADIVAADKNGGFLPLGYLYDQGWTATGTAETLEEGMHRFNPSAAQSSALIQSASHASGDFALLVDVKVVSGGSYSSDDCAVIHRRRNGSAAYITRIRCTTAGYRLIDGSGSGTTIATVAVDLTVKTQLLIVYNGLTRVTVFHRAATDSVWTQGATGTLGSDVSAATNDQYEVGCLTSTTADFRVGLILFMNKTTPFHRGAVSDTTTGVSRLRWGRALTSLPTPVRDQIDADGRQLGLSGRGGVARFGETWEIASEWDYGVRHLDPVQHPSPRRSWRSTSDEDEVTLVWDLGSDTRLGSSWVPALSLVRTNLYRCYLEVSTAAAPTTWIELGQYDSRLVVSGSFVLEGNLVKPAAGTARGKRYIGDGHAAQGFVILDPGGTPVVRAIKANTGGLWSEDGPPCYLELEGIDGTEPTSGTLHVFAGFGVLVCSEAPATSYRRVRIRIPAQNTPDGYFEIGSMLLGSVHAMGKQHSRGWSWRYVPIVRESEDEQGVSYLEPRIDAPDTTYRRELQIAWQDGAADARLNTRPRWLAPAGSAEPLVAEHDVFRQLVGLLRRSRGGQLPAAALLEVPAHTETVTDPLVVGALGRLIGTAQRNNVQGDEGRSEISRTESILWQEIP
jgi:hypothetical protein